MGVIMILPPPFIDGTENINAIVETPKGSAQKYDYDKKNKWFKLKKIMPAGMVFPFDFGFIPARMSAKVFLPAGRCCFTCSFVSFCEFEPSSKEKLICVSGISIGFFDINRRY